MTRLLEKDAPFFFPPECVDSFRTLKTKLCEAPILIAPDWGMPFELMCDASDFAIGAVLGQRQDKHFRPIHYASKTMTEAESKYTTTEKGMLAVVLITLWLTVYYKEENEATSRPCKNPNLLACRGKTQRQRQDVHFTFTYAGKVARFASIAASIDFLANSAGDILSMLALSIKSYLFLVEICTIHSCKRIMIMDNSYESNIDKEASDFIKTIRERNFKDANEITNISEFILPTQPRIMFQSSSPY
nr:reverse transcriptase domain-containing protein [Tanacetum cinerariifolium]